MVDDEAELPLIGPPDRNPAARTCTRTLTYRECWRFLTPGDFSAQAGVIDLS